MLSTNVFSIHSHDGSDTSTIDAARIHVVDHAPSEQLGADGDMAVRTNGEVYAKASGTWTLRGSIISPEELAKASGPAPTVINDTSRIAAPGFYVVREA